MIIKLIPQRRDDVLSISKAGDALTINGTAFDFSGIPEGATLPACAVACEYVVGNVERIAGALHLSILLPTGVGASHAANFPALFINPEDGNLELPA